VPPITASEIRAHCRTRPGAGEDFPFGPEVLACKICGRIFALLFLTTSPLAINLKCDPLRAAQLRQYYPAIRPGYHMNKRHWNTVVLDGSIPPEVFFSLVDDSYALVVAGLPKAVRPPATPPQEEAP
jgi:predicted DNA-binding protein (MmcQ/YjbR family)